MSVMVSEKICSICLESFTQSKESMSPQSNKEFSNVLGEKPVNLVDLLLELRTVVIKDSEDGKMR